MTTPYHPIHPDHLNTRRLVADSSGTPVWKWDQAEPFGVNTPDENPSSLGAFEFPIRFLGQYSDKETSLAYNYFRDYDPTTGRYAQSDPIGIRGGLNSYLYVAGQPTLKVDPRGLLLPALKETLANKLGEKGAEILVNMPVAAQVAYKCAMSISCAQKRSNNYPMIFLPDLCQSLVNSNPLIAIQEKGGAFDDCLKDCNELLVEKCKRNPNACNGNFDPNV